MDGFESYLLLKGLSPTTIRDTIRRAKKIISQIGEITQENVTAYVLKQKHDGRVNNGINVDIKAIKHYLKYLKLDTKIACFLLPENQSDREILSDGEIAEFLAVQRPTDGNLDWGVYWLLTIYCGLRCGETSRLQVSDLDFGSKTINLKRSKTGPRKVVMPDIIIPPLQEYVKKKKLWLFPGNGRNAFNEPVIVAQSWGYDFHQRIKLMAHPIKRKVTPHSLRHSYATRLLNNGAEITLVQRALGHKDIATTAIYRNICTEDVRRMVHKCDSLVRSESNPKFMLEYVKDAIKSFGFENDDRFNYEFTESGSEIHLKVSIKK